MDKDFTTNRLISVIVPIYNVEPYLHQCVDSICNQTYRNLEILLIDDGSPDRCGEICEEYAKRDNRIRVIHTDNRGLSGARNLGLQKATGDYIGFVDSDDWIEPNMYEILLQRLDETGADISVCGFRHDYPEKKQISTNDKKIQNVVYAGIDSVKALVLFKMPSYAWNKLYKKDCWNSIRFPEGHVFEDVATLYKVFLKTPLVSYTSRSLYNYRIRENSITHTYSMNHLIDCWNAYYRRYSFLHTLPGLKNDQLIGKAETMLALLAVRTWQRVYSIPSKQRDYVFLRTISLFVRNRFPFFGKRRWGLRFRTKLFFARYANELSFACMFYLEKVSNFARKRIQRGI